MSKSSKEEKSNTLKRSWFQELKGESSERLHGLTRAPLQDSHLR